MAYESTSKGKILSLRDSRAAEVVINRWLPYWAVLQADFNQTVRSWVWRTWVAVCILATVGWLVYRLGAYKEAGLVQGASDYLTQLVRWMIVGSISLVVILAAGSISSERGTLADSILSRGISRRQYYLGKLHARIGAVLAGFFLVGIIAMALGQFFLREDLDIKGCFVAMAEAGALLVSLVSFGVMASAILNNTLVGIMVLWLIVYGGGALLSMLPAILPQLGEVWNRLPNAIKGYYNLETLGKVSVFCLAICVLTSLIGMVYFSRRDV